MYISMAPNESIKYGTDYEGTIYKTTSSSLIVSVNK